MSSDGKMSVSRPISTLKRGGTHLTYSCVFCRSPEESLTPRMLGISASRPTVSGSIFSPPQVEGLLYSTTGREVLSAICR